MQARADGLPRPFAWLLLWGAVMMSAYVGVCVFFLSSGVSAGTGTITIGLLLPTALIYSLLVAGTRERFSARLRFRGTFGAAVALLLAGSVVLVGVAIFGPGYPWWVAIVVAGAALLMLGTRPALLLLRTHGVQSAADPWRAEPLSRSARIVTVAVGLFLGLSTALASVPLALTFVSMPGFVVLVVASAAPGARWGVGRAGYEWGRTQWCAYGAAVAVMYVLAVVLALVGTVPVVASVVCGVVVAGIIAVAAFIPRRR
ncbi:hypothetical protein ASE14_00995 [Agromyces sp. Root81]|nr:hypothetical protein ASE14_00995 [Agromyces sp. Root81]